MEKEYDKQTFKLKKNPRKRNKDKESNSSRDSLELTIQSYKDSNQISQKVTEKGEKIKFFFNDISTTKNSRFATASNRKSPKINSISSLPNDEWTLKKSSNLEMKHECKNLGDNNEYNILAKNKKNERQSQEIYSIRQFKKYIIFKVTLAIIVLFIEKITDIIYLIFADFRIIGILLKIKNLVTKC